MPIEPLQLLLGAGAAFGVFCWTVVVSMRLATARSVKVALIPAVLLAVAAFAPTALTIINSGRESIGESQFGHILLPVYLLGAGITAIVAPRALHDERGKGIMFLAVAYWLLGAISDWNAGLTTGDLSFFVVPIALLVAWYYRPKFSDAIGLLTWVLVGVCAVSLLMAVFDKSAAFTEEATRVVSFFSPHRLAGITEHPNTLGLYAALGAVLAWRRKAGWVRFAMLAICGIALAASDSRTAWLACAAGFVVFFMGRRQQAKAMSPWRLIGAAVLMLIVAWVVIKVAVPEHDAFAFNGRSKAWNLVIENWTQTPLIGHSPSIWVHLIAQGIVPEWIGQAHNQFLQTLFTLGLVGVAVLLAILWLWTKTNLRSAQAGYLLPLALQAVIVVDCIFESRFTLTAIQGDLWLFSILLFLQPRLSREHSPSPTRL
jgi:O-Antigen ligase